MKRAWLAVCIAVAAAALVAVLATPAYALVPDGQHGWFWQMPQPTTNLNDVAFAGAGQVWAVGVGGTIQHSTDGGLTWAGQTSGSDADLWSVSFVDAQHGWVVGGQATAAEPGVILVTSNGGVTWTDQTPAGFTGSLTNVTFADATHGWAGTTDGSVLKTTNGGVTWQQVAVAGGYSGYLTVDFADATHGWAGGTKGRIWTTVNGGKTWTGGSRGMLSPQTSVVQLAFVDRSDGWVLAQDQWGDSFVMATNDGGRFWRPVPTGYQYTTAICATSQTNVWLVGQDWGGYDNEGPTMFLHSSDGGFRWHTSYVNTPAMPFVMAASGNAACAVGDGVVVSSDAGATWQSASSGQQYWFAGADALDAHDIWAVDSAGALLHSTDGLKFAEQATPARWASSLLGVAFPDADDGWLVGSFNGDGAILHTTDGGASWAPQQSELSGELVGVDFLDASTGWAISDEQDSGDTGAPLSLEHTTDGGATWIPQYVYSNTDLNAIDFLDASTGWASGGFYANEDAWQPMGAIFHSIDDGYTWTKEKLPKGAPDMTGLQFLDANVGWATGVSYDDNGDVQQAWVLQTTDGGTTWTRRADLNDTLATTVHFSDAQHGWLGGLNGVYATSDGGSTWQRVAGGYGVEAIAATDQSHVWAFGDGFLVSTLDTSADTAAPATFVAGYDFAWHRDPTTVRLSADDVGGSGVASTQSSFDGGPWTPGAAVAVPAAADHRNDGVHTILYRSTDNAGNQEQTEQASVLVDTLGPACAAPRAAIVDAGKKGVLDFIATDDLSGVKQATVSIVGAHGHVLRSFVERESGWYGWGESFYWLRFRCNLKPGTYHVVVRAVDWAGNHQVTVGRNTLRVVRRGAPAVSPPGWPAGLPSSDYWDYARLNHGLRSAWLLRQPGSPAVVRAAAHRGAWQAAHWPLTRVKH